MTEEFKPDKENAPAGFYRVPEWPDVSAPTVRKCPRHKAWVQAQQSMGVIKSRYCPRCEVEKAAYEKHKQALAGVDKPKVIIRKI